MTRRRPPGYTTSAGLGAAHQSDRAALLTMFEEGTRCRRCGRPMYSWQRLHAGHPVSRALGYTGPADALEHGSCNESAGARLGNALRRRGRGRRTYPRQPGQRTSGGPPVPRDRSRW